ncbi:MAG: hypothetical protein DWQ01_06935 [Planctomycetota bacterium]|nr:MAG: hypothetical protein DWQ01_06935 [Planctomycetota bacterium]
MQFLHRLALLCTLLILPACPQPDFERDAQPPGSEELRLVLPVFRVPELDSANPLLAVFIDMSRPGEAELNVIFSDEDHIWEVTDLIYDGNRWWGWFDLDEQWPFFIWEPYDPGLQRIADVESIRYEFPNASASGPIDAERIQFPGTYSKNQTWNVPIAFHYSSIFDAAEFEQVQGRPVVYVNTWNHMFAPHQNNPNLPWTEIADYPIYKGTREELEALYQAVWTDFGLD